MVVGGFGCVRARVGCRVRVDSLGCGEGEGLIKASAGFDCGDVGRLRGPAAQERELEHLIEPYAQHLDASSRTRATRPSLQNLVRPWSLRPPMRAAGCTGRSRPGGDHDHGANVSRASKEGPSRSVPRSTRVL
eukprot:scaffold22716_cov76-Phaeocystis_antarctica.AAC.1